MKTPTKMTCLGLLGLAAGFEQRGLKAAKSFRPKPVLRRRI